MYENVCSAALRVPQDGGMKGFAARHANMVSRSTQRTPTQLATALISRLRPHRPTVRACDGACGRGLAHSPAPATHRHARPTGLCWRHEALDPRPELQPESFLTCARHRLSPAPSSSGSFLSTSDLSIAAPGPVRASFRFCRTPRRLYDHQNAGQGAAGGERDDFRAGAGGRVRSAWSS